MHPHLSLNIHRQRCGRMLVHSSSLDESTFERCGCLGGDDITVAVRGGSGQRDESHSEPTPQSEEDRGKTGVASGASDHGGDGGECRWGGMVYAVCAN